MIPEGHEVQEIEKLRAQAAALEDLLEVQEQVVMEQSDRLEKTLAELQNYAGQLELQQVELSRTNRQLTEANARLEALATTDGLTGLKNHRTFQERLAQEFERSLRYDASLSLILLDVDRFKQYNDSFGHPAGDLVLKQVADILAGLTRVTDVVARYGGEEFAILLIETPESSARLLAERLRMTIEYTEWTHRPVTASLGIATLTPDTADIASFLTRADNALYYSKQHGRNRVTHTLDIPDIAFPLEKYTDLIQAILSEYNETLAPAPEQIRETLTKGYDAAIERLSRVLDLRDHETEGHSLRVTELTVQLARNAGMTEEEVLYARWGALLHDIGKMGIPDSILLKKGELTEEEWTIMRRHPTIAYEMLAPITFLRPALDIPYYHHEKWDGTGYPHGLKGDDIPIVARLFAVVDVWDALSSNRAYRKAWPKKKVLAHLRALSGTHFDPRAVRLFLKLTQKKRPEYDMLPAIEAIEALSVNGSID